MPLMFAYGSNMDVAAMAQRCPRSRALGAARLVGFRFCIMPEGWGNVITDPRAVTHGVLWDVALADMRALDAYEQVERGLYRKITQSVIKAGGGAARALVYVGKAEGGTPRLEYIDGVIAAARAWKLPEAHVKYLETFRPGVVEAAPKRRAIVSPEPKGGLKK
jgi:gamma-glutamylcyclotransferase (GGCT)/AIG2-like uncharacterized protein YtfP